MVFLRRQPEIQIVAINSIQNMASAVFMFAPQRPRFFSADDWCIEFCILFIPYFLFPIPMFRLFCQNLWAPFTERLPTTFACFCTATLHNSLLYHHLLTSRNPVIARSYKFKKREPCHSIFFRRNISEKKTQRSCFRWYLTYLVCVILNILCKKFGILFEFSLTAEQRIWKFDHYTCRPLLEMIME